MARINERIAKTRITTVGDGIHALAEIQFVDGFLAGFITGAGFIALVVIVANHLSR